MKFCVNCGVEFEPNSSKQVCCSKKCNAEKWRKLNPERAKENERRATKKRRGEYRYNSKQRKLWYERRKIDPQWREKLNVQGKVRYQRVQEFLREYKLSRGCKDCGYRKHHAALEFDHISGKKEINVCFSKSIEQAKKEIEKCEVVCSCCHRIRTFERLQKG